MWTCGIGSCLLFILLLFLGECMFPSTAAAWYAVIGLAVLPQTLGQGLLVYSLKHFSASLIAVSMLTVPIIASILAMLLFDEHLTTLNWFGFVIVLLGIYVAVSDPGDAKTDTDGRVQ